MSEEEKQVATVPAQKSVIALHEGKGLVPTDFDGLWRLAHAFAASGLMPKGLQRAEQAFVALQFGFELGLSPMQAVQNIAVINGRPTVWGDTPLALVRVSGLLDYIKEWFEGSGPADAIAHCEVKRRNEDEPVIRSFSIADAKVAGLLTKDSWKHYPKRMCQMRARGWALKDLFPDVLKGVRQYEYDDPGEPDIVEAEVTGQPAVDVKLAADLGQPGPAIQPEATETGAGDEEVVEAEFDPAAETGVRSTEAQNELAMKRGLLKEDEGTDSGVVVLGDKGVEAKTAEVDATTAAIPCDGCGNPMEPGGIAYGHVDTKTPGYFCEDCNLQQLREDAQARNAQAKDGKPEGKEDPTLQSKWISSRAALDPNTKKANMEKGFAGYLIKHLDAFRQAPEEIKAKVRKKWANIAAYKGIACPIDVEPLSDDEDEQDAAQNELTAIKLAIVKAMRDPVGEQFIKLAANNLKMSHNPMSVDGGNLLIEKANELYANANDGQLLIQ